MRLSSPWRGVSPAKVRACHCRHCRDSVSEVGVGDLAVLAPSPPLSGAIQMTGGAAESSWLLTPVLQCSSRDSTRSVASSRLSTSLPDDGALCGRLPSICSVQRVAAVAA